MCGIIGYLGKREALPIIIDGLRRLEYRGYDSAGVAILDKKNKLHIRKIKGKLIDLENVLIFDGAALHGNIGIGHTRWATHGKPSKDNAHPHNDCKRQLAVVHNGIIENFFSLREELKNKGHIFSSQTDTEVIIHLVEENLLKENNLEEAIIGALKRISGSYAVVFISTIDNNKLIGARCGSPLILGIGKEEFFLASDIPAILPYTKEVIFLDDYEMIIINKKSVNIINFIERTPIKKSTQIILWDVKQAEKAGYKHFMLKEIHEQPQAVNDTIRTRIDTVNNRICLEEDISLDEQTIKKIKKIYIVACGTAYHAGLVGKFFMENIAKLPTEVDIASEFRYRNPLVEKTDLVLAISQSGETADTLAAIDAAEGAYKMAICNVLGSNLTRKVNENVLYTHAGPEISVASTKAFTAQLAALFLLSLYFAQIKKINIKEDYIKHLMELLNKMKQVLQNEEVILTYAKHFYKMTNFLYLGRGINYPIALEGALKLKEISYIHAEAYPAGEMKHGPIALIDNNMPSFVIATQSITYEKIINNIEEIKAREGTVIALATEDDELIKNKVDKVIYLPKIIEILSPILNVIPLQLFAYYIGVRRGCDVDQPRNLAKSVTVE